MANHISKINVSHKIFENARKAKSNYKYLTEDYLAVTTIGNLFKQYQNVFLAELDSAIVKNYAKLNSDIQEKITSDQILKVTFIEKEDGDFEINFIFQKNEIMSDETSFTMKISAQDNFFIINFDNVNENFSKSEISTLLSSYNDITCSVDNFSIFIDKIRFFISDLVYLYIKYLNSYDLEFVNTEIVYKSEMIKSFMDYLSEEINREIFSNTTYQRGVTIIIDKDNYTISCTVVTPDKLNFLNFDYVFSPEINKFVQINISQSISTDISKITELFTDNLIDFIKAFKDDLVKLYSDYSPDIIEKFVSEEKQPKLESNILYNLKSVDIEKGIICIAINGVDYEYFSKNPEKTVEKVKEDIIGILSSDVTKIMSYIENNLELYEPVVIEENQMIEKKDKKDKKMKTKKEQDSEDDAEDDKKDSENSENGDEQDSGKDSEKTKKDDEKEKKESKEIKTMANRTKSKKISNYLETKKHLSKLKKEEYDNQYSDDEEYDENITTPQSINAYVNDDIAYVEPEEIYYNENDDEDEYDDMYGIMYIDNSDDDEDLLDLFDDDEEYDHMDIIDYIENVKYKKSNEILVTDNFKEDLQITGNDNIFENKDYKLIYNENDKRLILLKSVKAITEGLIYRPEKPEDEDTMDVTIKTMNYNTRYGPPNMLAKSLRSAKYESKRIINENKRFFNDIIRFLKTEGHNIDFDDISLVNKKVFESFMKKNNVKYFESIVDEISNKKYSIGIFNDVTLVSENAKSKKITEELDIQSYGDSFTSDEERVLKRNGFYHWKNGVWRSADDFLIGKDFEDYFLADSDIFFFDNYKLKYYKSLKGVFKAISYYRRQK